MNPRRHPAVAGRFYPDGRDECLRALDTYLDQPAVPGAIGGLVPHAGWMFSGATAGHTFAALREADPETVIIFGAVHVGDANQASLFQGGAWETPLGETAIDQALAAAVAEHPAVAVAPEWHMHEHSIEVEVPFVQRLWPQAKIVPVMVLPTPSAAAIGRHVGEAAAGLGRRVVVIASTDLTHYGPRFGFEPAGSGPAGVRWAKEVNDRRFIDLVCALAQDEAVLEATQHHNACGSGAVAASIAAAITLGAARYRELRHTSSAEVMAESNPVDAVGYHAGVFVAP